MLDLIDDDRVCLTNLNRQLHATRKTVGKYKVDVAEERVHEINPECRVNTYKTFYMPDTREQFDFAQYDYVIDAIDTVTGKLSLISVPECGAVTFTAGQKHWAATRSRSAIITMM
jgi:tRNA A37 threonylcarbamoyladenosine dehydratase